MAKTKTTGRELAVIEAEEPQREAPAAKAARRWPAEEIVRMPIESLIPYARNARKHSAEQVAQIAASMKEWGWTNPVLIDEGGTLIAGHGRVLAARKLGIDSIPCMIARGWNESQKRAYVLADNQLALNAEWDNDLLKVEIEELKLDGFDLDLMGFGNLDEILGVEDDGGEGDGEGKERELVDDEKSLWREAWRRVAALWVAEIDKAEGLASANLSKEACLVHFLRCLFHGGDIPRSASLAYTKHRVLVSGDKGPIIDFLRDGLKEDAAVDSLIWGLQGKPLIERIPKLLALRGYRMPGDFPAALARDLIEEFTPQGGAVLDPCHGWGGRMLGFLLSRRAATYTAFDVDPRTSAGVQGIFDDLSPFAMMRKEASLTLCPFEDSRLPAAAFDFALTSPPYFDTEKYGGDDSSWKRHAGGYETWVDGFYRPLLVKAHAALRPGAVFALQVGNQRYPLEETAKTLAPEIGFDFVETRGTDMTNNQVKTEDGDGEVIVLFRKRKASR